MTRVILSTVGTSLLSNAKRENLETDEQLLEFLRREPRKASAETNALDRLLEPTDRAVMLFSDTKDGERCAQLIARHLERTHFAETEPVLGLNYHERGFVQYGLRNLVQALANRIRKARRDGHDVIINATGGFKAEIAYATALGLVFKVPVCYIHEAFGDIVTLPATPFGWDPSLILEHEEFFVWVDEELRRKDKVGWRVKQLPEAVSLLLEDTPDGFTVLSALGQTYLEAFRAELERARAVPVVASRSARRDWADFDNATRAKYERLLDRLRLPNRTAQSELKSGGGDALVYPKGKVNERVFYAEKDGQLYIFEFARHDRRYEERCEAGLRWRDYPSESFAPLES